MRILHISTMLLPPHFSLINNRTPVTCVLLQAYSNPFFSEGMLTRPWTSISRNPGLNHSQKSLIISRWRHEILRHGTEYQGELNHNTVTKKYDHSGRAARNYSPNNYGAIRDIPPLIRSSRDPYDLLKRIGHHKHYKKQHSKSSKNPKKKWHWTWTQQHMKYFFIKTNDVLMIWCHMTHDISQHSIHRQKHQNTFHWARYPMSCSDQIPFLCRYGCLTQKRKAPQMGAFVNLDPTLSEDPKNWRLSWS